MDVRLGAKKVPPPRGCFHNGQMLEEAFFPLSPLLLDRLPFNYICSSFFLTLSFAQDAS
jgi:hypothetical protein